MNERPKAATPRLGAGKGKPRSKRARQQLRRHKEVMSAGALVSETLASYGLTETLRGYRIPAEWSELVGERIARRTKPLGIVGPQGRRVLQVQVASSAWLHELGLLKAQLLDVLWKAIGEPRLFDDMTFQLAGRSRSPNDAPGTPPAPRPRERPKLGAPVEAKGADRERILSETSEVDDDELRALIARVRTRHNR